ncbi:pyrimidine 5'-nucleotidase [Paracoccus liaowanqingii]|uniref:Pyrimidine 5'-nucleotidase n=1 Tax=Paracoccus liaowanqingii TaxID=2560053 RepID=A0A4Z1C941_9RHOB|nr:pyrimidine 5'-nucleotidase [Paracoccus liaowanqingii]TGN45759.1 pyrimidine 5'-nucleotidase [Paracoccus liaowanqingii]
MDFSNVRVWIFDLDNTLYPPEAQLFAQIETRMTAWMMRSLGVPQDHANRLRADYWRLHGTTLAGLMAEHAMDPADYLADVHDIDFSVLTPDPDLAQAIAALPGRRIIHTNGDAAYARRVLAARHLPEDLFEAVYGIEETGFHPKPGAEAFDRVLTAARIDPRQAAFFEDDPRNLIVPHRLGMRTVLVGTGRHGPEALTGAPGPHVQHQTHDLTGFLRGLELACDSVPPSP